MGKLRYTFLACLLAFTACSSDTTSGNTDIDAGVDDATTTPDGTTTPDQTTGTCTDDTLGNTTAETAATAENRAGLTICPGVADYYRLDLEANRRAFVEATFTHSSDGDIDIWVYNPGEEDPFDAAESEDDNETLEITSGDEAASFIVAVVAYTFDGEAYELDGQNTYDIAFTIESTCTFDDECDEGEACDIREQSCGEYVEADCGADGNDPAGAAIGPNGTDSRAYDLNLGTGEGENLTLTLDTLAGCGDDLDWFAFTIEEDGHGVEFALDADEDDMRGALTVIDRSSDEVFVASADGDDPTLNLFHGVAGDYLLVAQIAAGSEDAPEEGDYTLTATYDTEACTDIDSCLETEWGSFCSDSVCGNIEGEGEVELGSSCDDDGDCDSEYCFTPGENPAGWICVDDADCTAEEDPAECGDDEYCNEDWAICAPDCVDDGYCGETALCETGGCVSRECFGDTVCTDRSGRPDGEVCVLSVGSIAGSCVVPETAECAGGDDNDRAATADELTLTEGSATVSGEMCEGDLDLFVVTTPGAGSLEITLTYDAPEDEDEYPADLDVIVIPVGAENAIGRAAMGPVDPETEVRVLNSDGDILDEGGADFIEAGDYILKLENYDPLDSSIAYELTVTFTAGTWSEDADCLSTRPLRASCDSACVDFDGNGEQENGEACDNDEDCVQCADGDEECEEMLCNVVGEGADTQNYCTSLCGEDGSCTVGECAWILEPLFGICDQ